jgi:hypothetical protein
MIKEETWSRRGGGAELKQELPLHVFSGLYTTTKYTTSRRPEPG